MSTSNKLTAAESANVRAELEKLSANVTTLLDAINGAANNAREGAYKNAARAHIEAAAVEAEELAKAVRAASTLYALSIHTYNDYSYRDD